jgi:hypothetical protein
MAQHKIATLLHDVAASGSPIFNFQLFDPSKCAVIGHQNGSRGQSVSCDHQVKVSDWLSGALKTRAQQARMVMRRRNSSMIWCNFVASGRRAAP